ncbi:hypothetical protein PDPE_1-02608 [Photobacterium damselae subsp. piscicida]|nr:hypothetical protein PDPE_1-02608 [Photobacterium damselae subsp. piscicida]
MGSLPKIELNRVAPNSIWTIAVLENPALYGHFDPLRQEYRKGYATYTKNSLMNRIVRIEGIEDTYKHFYGCNIKMTDSYLVVTPIDLLMVKFTFYKRSNNLIVHLFAFRKTNGFSY